MQGSWGVWGILAFLRSCFWLSWDSQRGLCPSELRTRVLGLGLARPSRAGLGRSGQQRGEAWGWLSCLGCFPAGPSMLSGGGAAFLGDTTLFQLKSHREPQYVPKAQVVKEDSSRSPIPWMIMIIITIIISKVATICRVPAVTWGLRTQVPTFLGPSSCFCPAWGMQGSSQNQQRGRQRLQGVP